MIDKIKEHITQVEAFSATTLDQVEDFRIKYLGSKGLLKAFFAAFKEVSNDQKKEFGQAINTLKNAAQEKVNSLKVAIDATQETSGVYGDLSRPGAPITLGSRHPISIVKNKITSIFSNIGFNVSEGPEIEDDWHNFTALN
ncbi:MAG TPA: phenylalanine--tRNA ligase subunit alpha, partial [Flavobacteriaceae bacterium]|nr:phenylalanine--tRNA ligase subunit alpha [Flavobacteriaceae bacterium]